MLAAVVAWQQNGSLPTRTKQLMIDGTDVLLAPGSGGNRAGVPIESIQLTEQGPGQVSSLRFRIEDPLGVVTLALGGTVRFDDLTRGLPLFSGFLESYTVSAFGVARQIEVTCVGIEIVLDWMYVPTFTIPTGTKADDAVASIVAAATGVSVPLRVSSNYAPLSTQARPVALAGTVLTQAVIIPSGTLRQALDAFVPGYILALDPAFASLYGDTSATVDFYSGLRFAICLDQATGGWQVTDYIDKSFANPAYPSGTRHMTDSSTATRGVWVTGGNAAGTGLVVDGSGIPGPIAAISDSNSLTAEYKTSLGRAYLGRNSVSIAGSVTGEEVNTPGSLGAEIRAGMAVVMTDVNVGLTTMRYRMATIEKMFYPSGSEDWTISYGQQASGAQYIRRLTRAVLNN